MMSAVGLPTDLIRYASENNISQNKPHSITWRMKAYTGVMCLLIGILAYLLISRTDVGVTLLRTPGQLYQEQPDNKLSNLYNYKILNKTFKNKVVTLRPENFEGTIKLVGEERLLIPKDGWITGTLFIYINKSNVKERSSKIKIGVYENGVKIKTINTSFLGPFNGA